MVFFPSRLVSSLRCRLPFQSNYITLSHLCVHSPVWLTPLPHQNKVPIKAMAIPIITTLTPPSPIDVVVAAPPVKEAGAGPLVERIGLPVAVGAKVRVELNAPGGAMMISLGSGEPVGTAISGTVMLVAWATSLMEISGRVAITTAVPRTRVRVTVKVEVEVEVVVSSLVGAGAGSCGRAVARKGRRRMESERDKCGERIAARLSERSWSWYDDLKEVSMR